VEITEQKPSKFGDK